MEFAIQVRGSWDFLAASAHWAEDRSLAAIALPDHYLQRGDDPDAPAWDHLTHIAALAAVTSDIELVSMVSPVTFRHPANFLKMGVTIDEVSGGRFTLGLGAGWLDEEFEVFGLPYPDLATRMEMLEEAMAFLRAAVTPGSVGFEGKHYTLAEFDPHPHPVGLKLMAGGGGGPKARRIAALYADEYNLYATTPAKYREIREATGSLAAEAGRDPGDIMWTSAGPGVAAVKDSDYRAMLETMAERTGRSPEYIEGTWDERGYPHGSGSKPAEMVAALGEAGCSRFYAQVFVPNEDVSRFDLVMDAYMGR